jgi:hypothetical protein
MCKYAGPGVHCTAAFAKLIDGPAGGHDTRGHGEALQCAPSRRGSWDTWLGRRGSWGVGLGRRGSGVLGRRGSGVTVLGHRSSGDAGEELGGGAPLCRCLGPTDIKGKGRIETYEIATAPGEGADESTPPPPPPLLSYAAAAAAFASSFRSSASTGAAPVLRLTRLAGGGPGRRRTARMSRDLAADSLPLEDTLDRKYAIGRLWLEFEDRALERNFVVEQAAALRLEVVAGITLHTAGVAVQAHQVRTFSEANPSTRCSLQSSGVPIEPKYLEGLFDREWFSITQATLKSISNVFKMIVHTRDSSRE